MFVRSRILLAEETVLHFAPVHADGRIIIADAAVAFLAVEIIHLVAELHVVRQRLEPVAEAAGDHEHAFVFRAELHGDPLLIGGAPFAQIHGHVQDGAPGYADQLGLRHRRVLEMNAAEDALLGAVALVVLDKIIVQAHFLKVPGAPCLHEITPLVPEDLRLDDIYSGQFGFDFLHQYITFPSATAFRWAP